LPLAVKNSVAADAPATDIAASVATTSTNMAVWTRFIPDLPILGWVVSGRRPDDRPRACWRYRLLGRLTTRWQEPGTPSSAEVSAGGVARRARRERSGLQPRRSFREWTRFRPAVCFR
jgi:hypothetical protein